MELCFVATMVKVYNCTYMSTMLLYPTNPL